MLNHSTIHGLTPPVLFDLADHVKQFAFQLEHVANENERRLNERRNFGHQKRSVRAASIFFSKEIENGVATSVALEKASVRFCVKPEAITMTVAMFKNKQRRIDKINRDRRIMKMWRAGHPVTLVARKNGVTSRTVNRVVKELKHL